MRHPDGKKIAFNVSVGEAVQRARTAADVGTTKLAEAIGITRSTLAKIENGETPCPLYTLACIAEALDVTLDELVP